MNGKGAEPSLLARRPTCITRRAEAVEDTLIPALGGIIVLENIAKRLNELHFTALKDAP
jgi:hypothetical protein